MPKEERNLTGQNARATLSPPSSLSEAMETEIDADNRLLFHCQFELPTGTVSHSTCLNNNITTEYLSVGSNFLAKLDAKGQSFILSSAAACSKQRIFVRFRMPDGIPKACEFLCEFQDRTAKVTALSIRSAFGPRIQFREFVFVTKHSSTCALTHIDYASIPYLGILPTDLIGKSILSFVFAPDVNIVRQAHLDLHNSNGEVVQSIAELRFVAHNGAILRSRSEWSAYVNPWTRKIELVVARHTILGVPIGAPPQPGNMNNVLPMVMAKTFEDELRIIMNRPIVTRKQQEEETSMKARKTLAHFYQEMVEELVMEVKPNKPKLIIPVPQMNIEKNGNSMGNSTPTTLQTRPDLDKPTGSSDCKEEDVDSVTNDDSIDNRLSYYQINCLENVRRLLYSQSGQNEFSRGLRSDSRFLPSLPLTKEILEEHTRRFEVEYKDTWARRLKRLSDDCPSTSSPPPAKQPRKTISMGRSSPQVIRCPPPPAGNYEITYVPLDSPVIPTKQ